MEDILQVTPILVGKLTQSETVGLVIGRRNSALDRDYASVELDELLLFNATLSEEEIKVLSAYV